MPISTVAIDKMTFRGDLQAVMPDELAFSGDALERFITITKKALFNDNFSDIEAYRNRMFSY
jgi:hypothetical protein